MSAVDTFTLYRVYVARGGAAQWLWAGGRRPQFGADFQTFQAALAYTFTGRDCSIADGVAYIERCEYRHGDNDHGFHSPRRVGSPIIVGLMRSADGRKTYAAVRGEQYTTNFITVDSVDTIDRPSLPR